ncbi:hypothetical protein K2X85_13040 [bacterium]|jgi:hypothetical protein|nr:hypothetical protein [bacterium]
MSSPPTLDAGRQMTPPKNEFVYRPISTMAVLCLLAALMTLSSFLNPYIIAVAVLVLLVSIITSIRLDRAKEEYEGQFLAKLAILVGLVATLGATTTHSITYFALTREAREYGEVYLQTLLADNLEEAFRLRIGPQIRAICKDDVKEILLQYNENFDAFKKEAVTQTLRAGGVDSTIEYLGVTGSVHIEGMELIGMHYRVKIANEPRKTYEVVLGISGGVSEAGDWQGRQWFVRGNEDIKEVSAPATTPPTATPAETTSVPPAAP